MSPLAEFLLGYGAAAIVRDMLILGRLLWKVYRTP